MRTNKPNKDSIMNIISIDLDVLSVLVKGRVIVDENDGLIIVVHRLSLLYKTTKLMA